MPFGYIPDFQDKEGLKAKGQDLYLSVFGLPVLQRRVEARLVFRWLGKVEGQRILDVACGDGIFCLELAKRGALVEGIDFSFSAIERAKWRVEKLGLSSRVGLAVCSAAQMPYEVDFFHQAVCNCVLEHISDDVAVLKEINRVLKPDGTLIVTVPLDYETLRPMRRLIRFLLRLPPGMKLRLGSRAVRDAHSLEEFSALSIIPYDHARFGYSMMEIRDKFHQAGFEIRKTERYFKYFGTIAIDLMEGLSIFDIEKGGESGYVARHEWLFGLCFPFFYPLSLLDGLLPNDSPAKGVAVAGTKVAAPL